MVREDEGRDEIAATEQADACDNKMNQSYISQHQPHESHRREAQASMMAPSIEWLTHDGGCEQGQTRLTTIDKNRENYRTSFRQAQVLPQKVVSWGRKTMT